MESTAAIRIVGVSGAVRAGIATSAGLRNGRHRMNLGLLILRLAVGGFFIGHGAQKLFGSFGGPGLSGTAQFFESLGMKPGRQHATAAGVAEFAGGLLLVFGLFTPFA